MSRSARPLHGTRIVSLALNLPGPAALRRLADLGARCTKINPPAGDAMKAYTQEGYASLHAGIKELSLDLKSKTGQTRLQGLLGRTDVLLTSFRPSALRKLGLDWPGLHKHHPQLSMVRIVGASGAQAEVPGHDLTYQAEAGLLSSLQMPPSLFADMSGALMASEAALAALLLRHTSGKGSCHTVALADAAHWLALPRRWRMTTPDGPVGGAHAGYAMYACKDGRVAVAALESHFAAALCQAAGIPIQGLTDLFKPATHSAVAQFFAGKTRAQLKRLALQHDLPLHTLL